MEDMTYSASQLIEHVALNPEKRSRLANDEISTGRQDPSNNSDSLEESPSKADEVVKSQQKHTQEVEETEFFNYLDKILEGTTNDQIRSH